MNDEGAARRLGQNPGNDPQKDGERIGAAMTPSNAARDDELASEYCLCVSCGTPLEGGALMWCTNRKCWRWGIVTIAYKSGNMSADYPAILEYLLDKVKGLEPEKGSDEQTRPRV